MYSILKITKNANLHLSMVDIVLLGTESRSIVKFYKYSGSGNDFIFFNNMSSELSLDESKITKLCHRRSGVGADGVVLISESRRHDYKLRIFNSDGSEAEMCGNASRCSIHFADNILGIKKKEFIFETMNGVYSGSIVSKDEVRIQMTELFDEDSIDISDLGGLNTRFLNTGVPHAVIEVGSLSEVKFNQIAPIIRSDKRFGAAGTNVDFFEVIDNEKQHIKLRVFERGVEDETLCCGTGIMATAISCSRFYNWFGEIKVETKGGALIAIVDELYKNLYFQGEVDLVFAGDTEIV